MSCAMRAWWEIGLSRSVVRSCSRAMYSVAARLPAGLRLKNRNCRGSRRVSAALVYAPPTISGILVRPPPPRMPGAGQDQPADELGIRERDLLRDAAPEREAEQVDVLVAERADERGRVGGHRVDRVRDLAAGGADRRGCRR